MARTRPSQEAFSRDVSPKIRKPRSSSYTCNEQLCGGDLSPTSPVRRVSSKSGDSRRCERKRSDIPNESSTKRVCINEMPRTGRLSPREKLALIGAVHDPDLRFDASFRWGDRDRLASRERREKRNKLWSPVKCHSPASSFLNLSPKSSSSASSPRFEDGVNDAAHPSVEFGRFRTCPAGETESSRNRRGHSAQVVRELELPMQRRLKTFSLDKVTNSKISPRGEDRQKSRPHGLGRIRGLAGWAFGKSSSVATLLGREHSIQVSPMKQFNDP